MARLLAGTPVADDAVLCVSELAGNCVSHSFTGWETWARLDWPGHGAAGRR